MSGVCWILWFPCALWLLHNKFLRCASSRRQHQLPQVAWRVGTDYVTPTTLVRDLGIYVDSGVSMWTHVSRTVFSCFATLRQLRSIRRSMSQAVLLSLVLSRLDYGNATLAGLPSNQFDRLQSVMNTVARLVCSVRKYEHITPLRRDLYWLRVPERIEFKLTVLVCMSFWCLHGTAPLFLASELRHVADVDTRKRLRSSSTSALVTPSLCRTTIGDRVFFIAAPHTWNLELRHCIWDTRHLQALSENTSFCHVIPLIFRNCAHKILFCILTLKSVLEVIFRLLNDTLIILV